MFVRTFLNGRGISLIGLLLLPMVELGHAAVMEYSDRTAWSNAVGAPIITETFDGFVVDASFSGAPVSILNGTIEELNGPAANGTFVNMIDAPSLSTGGVNGTSHVLIEMNAAFELPPRDVMIRIDFNMGVSAWGADFSTVNSALSLGTTVLDVFDDSDQLLASLTSPASAPFWGFDLGAGIADHIVLSTPTAQQILVFDNMSFVKSAMVPEPGTHVLFALGLLAMRRRITA